MSVREAAKILGCSAEAVQRHLRTGRLGGLAPTEVERLASEVFAWRRHVDDRDPYWVTGQRAADLLGVSRSRLGQLADARQVPYLRHQDGTRLYRHRELANLRDSRESAFRRRSA